MIEARCSTIDQATVQDPATASSTAKLVLVVPYRIATIVDSSGVPDQRPLYLFERIPLTKSVPPFISR